MVTLNSECGAMCSKEIFKYPSNMVTLNSKFPSFLHLLYMNTLYFITILIFYIFFIGKFLSTSSIFSFLKTFLVSVFFETSFLTSVIVFSFLLLISLLDIVQERTKIYEINIKQLDYTCLYLL